MTKDKKTIIHVIVAVVLVVTVTVVTIFALNAINNQKNAKVIPTKQSVDALMTKAEEARKNNDKVKAKVLLVQAKQQVNELPKTDVNTNTSVDVSAQLCMLGDKTYCSGH